MNVSFWLDYKEHKTDSLLEEFEGNVGHGNCTIFAEMIFRAQHINLMGFPWCATFVHAVINRPDLLGRAHPGTRVLQRRMKRKRLWRDKSYRPRPGDLIFLSNTRTETVDHCGIVEKCYGSTVFSIEGNTWKTSKEESDVGTVARHVRDLSDTLIVGYASIGELWITENKGV